ncbi:MAG: hypothetical protein AAF763_17160, partial [Pseudomonadota bacterium]
MALAADIGPAAPGAVETFERHRAELIRQKRWVNLAALAIFAICFALSADIANLAPARLAEGVPRILEYFGTITPSLQWDVLFAGRDEAGNAVPGSLTFWYADFDKYVVL